ncbi:MAG: potassium-transporting ATPase subunit C [Thermoplasmata archaeon]
MAPPSAGAAVGPPQPSTPPRPPPAHTVGGHVRATIVLLVLTLLVSGFIYPLLVTGIAQVLDPNAANGSLLREPNGTVVGSSLIAQNTSAPYLFWERPSLTDYNTTLGAETPPGPTDPALGALLNETIAYMRQYGNFTVNATLPFWLVSPSASDVDPDLTPEAVLVQVPRVANASNLSIEWTTGFVNEHITNPPIPYVGVAYVDVLQLDIDLLPYIGR